MLNIELKDKYEVAVKEMAEQLDLTLEKVVLASISHYQMWLDNEKMKRDGKEMPESFGCGLPE